MSNGYRTRLRSRIEKQQTKYDEIFAAVVHPSDRSSVASELSDSNSSSDSSVNSKRKHNNGSTKKRCPPLTCSSCNAMYQKHSQFHAHIALEHGKTLIKCSRCNATSRSLWHTNVCRLCRSFSANLSEHEADHYRDRLGDNALFECSHCYRTFTHFPDLKKHLNISHQKKRLLREYHCQICSASFYSRHLRDQHFASHFQSVIDKVWKAIFNMQDRLGDKLQSNQCPICHFVMSSNRSFRLHVIHRHLLRDFHGIHELEAVAKEIGVKNSLKGLSVGRIFVKKGKIDSADVKAERRSNNKVDSKANRNKNGVSNVTDKEKEYVTTSEKAVQSADVIKKSSASEKEVPDLVQKITTFTKEAQLEEGSGNSKKLMTELKGRSEHSAVYLDDKQPSQLQNVGPFVCSTSVSLSPVQVNNPKNDGDTAQETRQSAEVQKDVNTKEFEHSDKSQQHEQLQQLKDNSEESSKIRKCLIAACLDKNSNVPRCTKCGDCFARMFDFEVHLMRHHLSLAFSI